MGDFFLLRYYQLPITNYQLPITRYQLPVTNYPIELIGQTHASFYSSHVP